MGIRDPLTYPNWVWILGVVLVLGGIAVIALGIYVSKPRRRPRGPRVRSLSAARRTRYQNLLAEIQGNYASGAIDSQEAHLAIAALVRAVGTERTRQNVESLTVREAQARFPQWTAFLTALQWCETAVFEGSQPGLPGVARLASPGSPQESASVQHGIALARAVIDQ